MKSVNSRPRRSTPHFGNGSPRESITSPELFDDPAAYERLAEMLKKIDIDHGTRGNYFYYLATAPGFFSPIVQKLGQAGLVKNTITGAG